MGGNSPAQQPAAPAAVHVPYVPQQGTAFQVTQPPVMFHLSHSIIQVADTGVVSSKGKVDATQDTGYGGQSTAYHRNGHWHDNRNRYGYGVTVGRGGAIVPYTGAAQIFLQVGGIMVPPRMNPPHSNVTKRYNNWNTCYSCCFNVADWHNSHTCNNRKPSHMELHTRANALVFINRSDPNVCTAGIHKM